MRQLIVRAIQRSERRVFSQMLELANVVCGNNQAGDCCTMIHLFILVRMETEGRHFSTRKGTDTGCFPRSIYLKTGS